MTLEEREEVGGKTGDSGGLWAAAVTASGMPPAGGSGLTSCALGTEQGAGVGVD